VRNHVKRRVREWFRTCREALPDGVDLVVIARQGAGELGGREVARQLEALAGSAVGHTP
jgi:ribonuclease P protein component